jgi:hypothetical protein
MNAKVNSLMSEIFVVSTSLEKAIETVNSQLSGEVVIVTISTIACEDHGSFVLVED